MVRNKVEALIQDQVDRQTERVFDELFQAGRIEFYLQCADCRHEIPPEYFFGGYQIRRRTPFIFTIADIDRLVGAASLIGAPCSLQRHTFSNLFALLSITASAFSRSDPLVLS